MPKVPQVSPRLGSLKRSIVLSIILAAVLGGAIRAQMLAPQGDASVSAKTSLFERTLTQTLNFEHPGAGLAALRLDNANGNVTITGGSDAAIKIVAKKELRGRRTTSESEARSLLEALRVEAAPQQDALQVHTVFPNAPSGVNLKVDYEIRIPRSMSVESTTTNGNLKIAEVGGPVRVKAQNGNHTYRKLGGALTAHGVNGNIALREVAGAAVITHNNGNIDCREIGGGLKINTNNGNIDVEDVGGEVSVVGRNGNMKCRNVAGALDLNSHTGAMEITQSRVFETMRRIQAASGTGGVRLTLDKAQPFALSASCNTGSIDCAFPVSIEGKGPTRRASGQVGQGGPSITLNVDTGRIEIRKK